MMDNAQMTEFAGYRNLVAALRDARAITHKDVHADVSDDSTPGRRVFQAIRVWVDDQVAARCKQGPEGCRKPPR